MATNEHSTDELLDTAEAAVLLHKPVGTLQQWRHRGIGPAYVKVGRSVRYLRSDLRSFLQAHRVEPGASS